MWLNIAPICLRRDTHNSSVSCTSLLPNSSPAELFGNKDLHICITVLMLSANLGTWGVLSAVLECGGGQCEEDHSVALEEVNHLKLSWVFLRVKVQKVCLPACAERCAYLRSSLQWVSGAAFPERAGDPGEVCHENNLLRSRGKCNQACFPSMIFNQGFNQTVFTVKQSVMKWNRSQLLCHGCPSLCYSYNGYIVEHHDRLTTIRPDMLKTMHTENRPIPAFPAINHLSFCLNCSKQSAIACPPTIT